VSGQPAVHAEAAAEAIRALNHATQGGAGGLGEPADAYTVLGHLATMAARLPQALDQLTRFLEAECDAGRLRVVDGEHEGDPQAAVAAFAAYTADATAGAQLLHAALHQAHNTLAWVASAHCLADD
jgi:hypothetical protein